MASQMRQLSIFFFPFMAHGHMIPTVDMAKLFASRGAKTAIVTTPLNVPLFARTIERSVALGLEIGIKIIKFPLAEAGLPEGCENLDSITSHITGPEATIKFLEGTRTLRQPLEQLLEECRPDCLVADMFFPWATEAAAKFGIPRLVFHGTSVFSQCTSDCVRLYEPHKKVSSDSEPFVVPYLPGDIKLTRKQLADFVRRSEESVISKLVKECKESELKSYGVVFNSFYELEPAYFDFYRSHLGKRAWHIGPLSLCNRSIEEKAERGKPSSIDEHECLKWLDSKKPNSVIYICFGTVAIFSAAQLMEIATGLEAAGQQFIWVVRKQKSNGQEEEAWLPEGFEKTMEGKGLIIRGWAPQVLILDHKAVGGFVTHCGWNSTLEGVSAGVPMVTWPVAAEQFYNEKLITQVLKIGVPVGVEKWAMVVGDFVKRDKIERAMKEIMMGDEAEERRSRAEALAEMARRAVEKGGSSYSDLDSLIQDLKLVALEAYK